MRPAPSPIIAHVALGSNLGSRLELLRAARTRLAALPGVTLLASSPLYETAPVGGPPGQGDFFNAVLELQAALTPQQLLAACLQIESDLGRVRGERWAARCIDLDLLFCDDLVMAAPELTLPHPRLHLRRFVLLPLADLAPGKMHPLLKLSIADLAAVVPDSGAVRRLQEEW